jgi:hypothetical protein
MVDKNDPLFREVEEELRRERWTKLWENYGTYLIGGAALIVAIVGGYKYWEAYRVSQAESGGARYEAARDFANSGKAEEQAKTLEEIIASGPKGYVSLAELTLAGTHLKAGRRDDALAIFEKLSKDGGADELLRSYGALQAAALRLGEADFTEMQSRLNPLIGADKPWRYNARELLGTAALSAGKLEDARNVFTPLIADPNVPEGTLERVRRAMAKIASAELAHPASEPKAEAPAASPAAEKDDAAADTKAAPSAPPN